MNFKPNKHEFDKFYKGEKQKLHWGKMSSGHLKKKELRSVEK